jgi:hypothetical protein
MLIVKKQHFMICSKDTYTQNYVQIHIHIIKYTRSEFKTRSVIKESKMSSHIIVGEKGKKTFLTFSFGYNNKTGFYPFLFLLICLKKSKYFNALKIVFPL